MACNHVSNIALASLSDVADAAGVTLGEDPVQDRLLARYLNSSSAQFIADIGYNIVYTVNVEEKVQQKWGNPRIAIKDVLPLKEVHSIEVFGKDVPAGNYSIEKATLGWITATKGTWPSTEVYMVGVVDSYTPVDIVYEHTVTYTGGYVTQAQADASQGLLVRDLPYDIEDAIIELCSSRYARQGYDATVASVRTGEWSIGFHGGKTGVYPQRYLDAVQRYKRYYVKT